MSASSLPTTITPTTQQSSPSHAAVHSLLHKYANQTYNVTDTAYGAAGDGTTDDTEEIQGAIDDAAAAGGGRVYLPEGTYVESGLQMKTGVWLLGDGHAATILKLKDASTAAAISLASAGVHSTRLEAFGILGNRDNQSSANARGIYYVNTGVPIDESGAKHIFRDLHVEYTYGDGVHLNITDGSCFLENVYVLHSNEKGMYLNLPDSIFVGCTTGQSGEEGMYIVTRGNNIFIACRSFRSGRVDEAQGDGYLINSNRNLFFACSAQDNKLHGFDVYQSDQNFVDGVSDTNGFTTTNSSQAGFRINAGDNNVIRGLAVNRGPSDLPAGGGNRYSLSLVTSPENNIVEITSVSPVTADRNGSAASNRVRINQDKDAGRSGTGTGTIANGATSATITHGLDITPTLGMIRITLGENPSNTPGAIFVDTIGATTFQVNCENDPGASGLDFGWSVS